MGIEPTYLAWKASVLPLNYTRKVGVTGFEPATSWSQTRRSSQAEPHPEGFISMPFTVRFLCLIRDARVIIYESRKNVNTFFHKFSFFLQILSRQSFFADFRHFRCPTDIRSRTALPLYHQCPSRCKTVSSPPAADRKDFLGSWQ